MIFELGCTQLSCLDPSTSHRPPPFAGWLPLILLLALNFVCIIMLGIVCYFCARTVASRRRENFRRLTMDSIFSHSPVLDHICSSETTCVMGLDPTCPRRTRFEISTPKPSRIRRSGSRMTRSISPKPESSDGLRVSSNSLWVAVICHSARPGSKMG